MPTTSRRKWNVHKPSNMPDEYVDIVITRKPIIILEPRWHDDMVLIGKKWVQGGWNKIIFTKTNSLPDEYAAIGEDIAKSKLGTNGKIPCYEYPLKKLKIIGQPIKQNEPVVEPEKPKQDTLFNNEDIRR